MFQRQRQSPSPAQERVGNREAPEVPRRGVHSYIGDVFWRDLAAQRDALVRSLRGDIPDERVLPLSGRVPRERFVLPEARELAYA